MTRFAPLISPSKNTVSQPIDWNDPGDFRNRGKGDALVPSQDAKYAKRLPEFRPQVKASSAKATASAAPVPVASAKPKAPIKSAAMIATEAYAERVVKVMNSKAAIGKKKAAAEMLGKTKASASEIIAQLASVETDAVREQAEQAATWKRAVAKANKIAGFPNDVPASDSAEPTAMWSKAIAKANAMNGFGGEA